MMGKKNVPIAPLILEQAITNPTPDALKAVGNSSGVYANSNTPAPANTQENSEIKIITQNDGSTPLNPAKTTIIIASI